MKMPNDPGLYSTRADGNDRSGAPLDMGTRSAQNPSPPSPSPPLFQTGEASWYGAKLAGRKTASGERFDPMAFTAAHNTLKLGTWVEVRRIDTGRTVRVRINDRGPHAGGRIIDLSRRAAEELDLVRLGVVRVELRVVDGP
jgi:rare lipoprotein A